MTPLLCLALAQLGSPALRGTVISAETGEPVGFSIAGSAYFDSLTYRLRFTVTALTRPERSDIRGLRTLVARTRFRDIAPGVVLQDHMRAVSTFGFGPVRSQVETQRTTDVRFRH